MSCCEDEIIRGFIRRNEEGTILWDTFSTDMELMGQPEWEYIEIPCGNTTTTSTTTSTSSSTTTTQTTPPPSTSTTTTTSTSTTSTTTTTSSTTTTTTTEATTTTTTTSTTTTTTSSTTTTTTTLAPFDGTFAVEFNGDADMAGTTLFSAQVNSQYFSFSPILGDGDSSGEVIDEALIHTITLYVNFAGSSNPSYAQANIRILIKDMITGGTIAEASPSGITSLGQIEANFTQLGISYPYIVLSNSI